LTTTPSALGETSEADRAIRVLAVDDSPANLMVLASFLRHANVDVRTVDNGAEALVVYQSFAPDIVFMDLSMPGIDGFEAATSIRAHEMETGHARTRIIALTAYEIDPAMASRIAITMDDHMSKPVRKQDIQRMLEVWAGAQSVIAA
jgi:CheY-like chemotaxis protein